MNKMPEPIFYDPKMSFDDLVAKYDLKANEREALRLRFVEDLTYSEAAIRMHMTSTGQFERFFARTLRKLRGQMTT